MSGKPAARQGCHTTHYDRILKVTGSVQGPLSREHHYDLRGQLTTLLTGRGKYHYRYDAAGRLSDAQTSFYQQHYRFDPAGNRLSTVPTPIAETYRLDLPMDTRYDRHNRLTEDDIFDYHYDLYGNLIQKTHKNNFGEVYDYAYDRSVLNH